MFNRASPVFETLMCYPCYQSIFRSRDRVHVFFFFRHPGQVELFYCIPSTFKSFVLQKHGIRWEYRLSWSFGTFKPDYMPVVTTRRCGRVVGQLLRFARPSYDPSWAPCTLHTNMPPPPLTCQNPWGWTRYPRIGAFQLRCNVSSTKIIQSTNGLPNEQSSDKTINHTFKSNVADFDK